MKVSLPPREETVRTAANWLVGRRPMPTPIVPALRSRFGLSPIEAIREADHRRKITTKVGGTP